MNKRRKTQISLIASELRGLWQQDDNPQAKILSDTRKHLVAMTRELVELNEQRNQASRQGQHERVCALERKIITLDIALGYEQSKYDSWLSANHLEAQGRAAVQEAERVLAGAGE